MFRTIFDTIFGRGGRVGVATVALAPSPVPILVKGRQEGKTQRVHWWNEQTPAVVGIFELGSPQMQKLNVGTETNESEGDDEGTPPIEFMIETSAATPEYPGGISRFEHDDTDSGVALEQGSGGKKLDSCEQTQRVSVDDADSGVALEQGSGGTKFYSCEQTQRVSMDVDSGVALEQGSGGKKFYSCEQTQRVLFLDDLDSEDGHGDDDEHVGLEHSVHSMDSEGLDSDEDEKGPELQTRGRLAEDDERDAEIRFGTGHELRRTATITGCVGESKRLRRLLKKTGMSDAYDTEQLVERIDRLARRGQWLRVEVMAVLVEEDDA
ncbi:hypothetical protein H0H81_008446 [Sphagnurus paluster]|uniref:Uncharacterized protein n=1 Tax=Sphagnurus paluster TaxID=117069 RepID=A0A9P7FXE9_9AGAR|nr:hypothetical protein H0H81_008446 [Sphagnurus paluster]